MRKALLVSLVLLAWPTIALGDDAGANDAGPTDAGATTTGCVEMIPKGAERPRIVESFPARGTSGWAATLALTIKHGKGERVLPAGLDLSNATEMKKVLEAAGFAVPEQDASAGARIWTEPEDKSSPTAITHVDVHVVLLPKEPGRNTLDLPALPIAVARANGEIATVCTLPHTIVVEDPIAEIPNAAPRPNPPARPQREEWTAMKKVVQYGSLGILGGLALAWLAHKIVTRPKPPPPPPPPRPPWEIALEKLDEVRHAGLLEAQRQLEYFDRVSDAVRGYLGARFGFDGLESTTDEILAALKTQGAGFIRVGDDELLAGRFSGGPQALPGIPLSEIAAFLRECDLVKFAKFEPNEEQCAKALETGERIVRATMPVVAPPPPPPSSKKITEGGSA